MNTRFNFGRSLHAHDELSTMFIESKNTVNDIYYNIDIKNTRTDNTFVEASFSENRLEAIIDRPSDYYVSIIRFSVPGSQIPIFFMPISPFPNINPLVTGLSVTLEYILDIQQVFIVYEPRDLSNDPPPPPTAQKPNWTRTNYFGVYTYDHMIDMINTALATAFSNLASPPEGSSPPTLCYDPETQLISWFVQRSFYGFGLTNPIKVYINSPLFEYLDGITYEFLGFNTAFGKDHLLVTRANICRLFINNCTVTSGSSIISVIGIPGSPGAITITTSSPHGLFPGDAIQIQESNSTPSIDGIYDIISVPSGTTFTIFIDFLLTVAGTYGIVRQTCAFVKLTQNYNTLYRWNSFKDLVFISSTLPVVNEYIRSNNAGQVNFQPILTDFEPILEEAGDNRSTLQYFPQGPYRLINMNGTIPLRKVDIAIFWKDELDNLYPVLLAPRQTASIKLLFTKK